VIAHVHTGLDESTAVLRARHPHARVVVFDASDTQAQTEPSIARARALDVPVVAYTFHPHPARLFAPARAPRLLTSIEERARTLHALGVALVVVEPFDAEFAALSADASGSPLLAACAQLGSGEPFTPDSAQSRLAILAPMPMFAHCNERELRTVVLAVSGSGGGHRNLRTAEGCHRFQGLTQG
jgi:hypothetical protein